jgi:hypothetical protein
MDTVAEKTTHARTHVGTAFSNAVGLYLAALKEDIGHLETHQTRLQDDLKLYIPAGWDTLTCTLSRGTSIV